MGYFKRKIDRARCRDLIRGLDRRGGERQGWYSWDGESWGEIGRVRYVRFSIVERDDWSGRRCGVFVAAGDLRREGRVAGEYVERLNEVLRWFGEYLPSPDLDEETAIFFFKSDGGECVSRVWDLIWILREHGLHVELQRVDQPGRVVYEDDYQGAAIPWRVSREL